MSKSEKIQRAIQEDKLPMYHNRYVGTPSQLARIAEAAHSTVRYACLVGKVKSYDLEGLLLVLDAQDLVDYFRESRPGRPQSTFSENTTWKSEPPEAISSK